MQHSPIHAKQDFVHRILSDEYRFKVPDYQRPYSWTHDQAGELFDDLVEAYQNDEESYFLGSIVLIKREATPDADVIDGQQRLTTLTLLLCLLRDRASGEMRESLRKRITADGDAMASAQALPRLTLRARDNWLLHDYFQHPADGCALASLDELDQLNDAQKNLRDNAALLGRRLDGWTDQAVNEFARFIGQRCCLVVVTTHDERSAYRIFSVLNDRGLDLSPTDILKARILGRISEEKRPAYADIWEGLEEDLGRDAFRDLFAHLRMWRVKAKLRSMVHEEFLSSWKPEEDPESFIDDQLAQAAEAYEWILGDWSRKPRLEHVCEHLTNLRRLDNHDWVPPALAFILSDGTEPETFFDQLERLAYSLFIRRANVNERISRYASVLSEIDAGTRADREGGAMDLTSAEKAETREQLNGPIYTIQRIRRPVLLRLDSALADRCGKYDQSIITVEHILPQNPESDSEWVSTFPDEDERDYWVHRLANLVLLSGSKNTQASNYDFETKKNLYFMRGRVALFALTSQVLQHKHWTPEVLEERQRYLLACLSRVWRLND